MKKITLSDPAIWRTLLRLAHGARRVSEASRRDFEGREIITFYLEQGP